MDDVISRQAAIDMVKGWNLNQHIMNEEDVLDDVNALPSPELERREGKWLRSGNCIFPYECDQCGDTNERATPFCPNCGADMREGDAE